MSKLLMQYIRMAMTEGDIARVPNQLLEPGDKKNKAEEESHGSEEADEVVEFSSIGGGNIMGYNLPLGMDPDAAGRQKNRPRRKKSK